MSLTTKHLKDMAVYFAPGAVQENGQYAFLSPVPIKCKWMDTQQEFLNKNGGRQISRSVIYVDRDLDLKGVIWQGELSDLTDTENPFANEGAWEIQGFDKVGRLRQPKDYLRVVYL